MAIGSKRNRAQLRRIVAAGSIASMVVLAGVVGLTAYSASAIDAAQQRTEARLVERRVDRALHLLRENVVSATVWNDACVGIAERDWDWIQINFGDYYADYMKHDVTLAYDEAGTPIYASRDSERQAVEREAAFARAVAPLAAAVRAEGAAKRARAPGGVLFGLDAVATRQAVVDVDGVLYLAVASTVVAEDAEHLRDLRFDPVVVSGRRAQGLVDDLQSEILVSGAHLVSPDTTARPAVTLRDAAGRPLAAVAWTPARPGREALRRAAPYVALGAAVLLAALAFGFLRISSLMSYLERNEVERDRALAEAQAAAAAKSRFLANMSHELRTPLNGIIAVATLLRDRQRTEQDREMSALIVSSAHVLEHLVNDVLDTAKIEAGALALEARPFSLRELVKVVADLHGAAAAARGVVLSSRVRARADLHLGDPTRLTQVLSNLLSNAVKFTASGQVRLTAVEASGGVRFTVTDTGVGFDPAEKARLFRPFEQADASTTRQFGGSGLGLAICASLVGLMGGRIAVRSAPGRGSAFQFRIAAPPASPAEARTAAPVEAPVEAPAGLRVLLAEDHPTNQKVVAMVLGQIGAELTIVEDGRAAVDAARAARFDLILMDIQMPVMDGLAATAEIRRNEHDRQLPRTPIVCLTANVGAAQIQACVEAGADRHLAKPFTPGALLAAVASAVPAEAWTAEAVARGA